MAKVSAEQLIVALMEHHTQKAAANALGISVRTVHEMMKDIDFKILYAQAQADLIGGAVNAINLEMVEAVKTISSIMKDEDNNVAVRLQAAQTILSYSTKLNDQRNTAEIIVDNEIRCKESRQRWGEPLSIVSSS